MMSKPIAGAPNTRDYSEAWLRVYPRVAYAAAASSA